MFGGFGIDLVNLNNLGPYSRESLQGLCQSVQMYDKYVIASFTDKDIAAIASKMTQGSPKQNWNIDFD